ncbi:OmpA family protein [bacterium]|nr:OmpA family protein [bacterium]MBU1982851.1 OmpA family protein [bacterium]
MNRMFLVPLFLAALSVLGGFVSLPAFAQSATELRRQAEEQFANAIYEDLDLLVPRQFGRAQDSYDAARKLIADGREENLYRMKLQQALDELDAARRAAGSARKAFANVLIEREAAYDLAADSINPESWKRVENLLRDELRQFERRSTGTPDLTDLVATYRAVRHEALRTQVLGSARARIREAEQKGAEKQVPTLLLRANQAVGRAEANLTQGKVEDARLEAQKAENSARQAIAMLSYIEFAQRAKQPWEAALLPYDDLLAELAAYLDGFLDLSRGGPACREQLFNLVDARSDSLESLAADQQAMLEGLEASLADAQTSLSDAQDRIAELEKRVATVENQRTTAREALLSRTETVERIARAQEVFKPGEAVVLQNADGNVTLRLQGLQFDAGATHLTKVHQKVLDRAIVAMAQFPGSRIRVEGHTDAGGGEEINQMLSESRAQQVAEYLAQKMKKAAGEVEYAGFGETKPIASNDSAEGRRRNRRIDVVLILQ